MADAHVRTASGAEQGHEIKHQPEASRVEMATFGY